MNRDTKQEILQTAKKLFNERGFNQVSTRDIADSLGISKGNLTYHFKRKEDIIEAIITEAPHTRSPEPAKNLAELNSLFLDIQQAVQENAYYFWHYAQLSQLSPKIRELQGTIYQSTVKKLGETLSILKESGMLRGEEFSGEYSRVIDTLILSSIYWMPFCKLKEEASQTTFQRHAWEVLHPLITEKGQEELMEGIDEMAFQLHAWSILHPLLTDRGKEELRDIVAL